MEKKETIAKEEARVYELGYHIISSIPEEKIASHVEAIKAIITKNGGSFIAEESASKRPLAYMMRKKIGGTYERFNEAYFGWIKFEVEAEGLKNIKTSLDAIESILRYLLISTVRENTYLGKSLLKEKADEVDASVKADVAGDDVASSDSAPVEDTDKAVDDLVK
jgi:ribosomal protein S6